MRFEATLAQDIQRKTILGLEKSRIELESS